MTGRPFGSSPVPPYGRPWPTAAREETRRVFDVADRLQYTAGCGGMMAGNLAMLVASKAELASELQTIDSDSTTATIFLASMHGLMMVIIEPHVITRS